MKPFPIIIAFLLALPSGLLSCESGRPTPVRLATVTAVGPAEVEPGDQLWIQGEGYVEGACELVFHGRCEVGREHLPIDGVRVPAVAVRADRIEVTVSGDLIARFAEESCRFIGDLEVRFPGRRFGQVELSARLDGLVLDLVPTGGAIAPRAERLRSISTLTSQLGLTLPPPDGPDGLLVQDVAPGSPADRAGFSPGDRLLALDGRALATALDLAVARNGPRHRVEVVSPGGQVREITLVIPSSSSGLEDDELVALLLFAAGLGLFAAFAAPRREARELSTSPRRQRWVELLAVVCPAALLPLVAARSGLALTLFLGATALISGLAAALLSERTTSGRLLRIIVGVSVVVVPVAMAAAGSLELGFARLVEAQAELPFGAVALESPFSLIALVATLRLAAAPNGAEPGPRTALELTHTGTVVTLSVCLLLGGWRLPGWWPMELGGTGSDLVTSLIFGLKVALSLLAAQLLARLDATERRAESRSIPPGNLLVALGLVASAALSVAWTVVTTLPEGFRFSARIVAVVAAVALGAALLSRGLALAVRR